jgi:thioredoxin reductase
MIPDIRVTQGQRHYTQGHYTGFFRHARGATGERQKSSLIAKLGCELDEKGRTDTGDFEEPNVSGLCVAGDASDDIQFAIVAAAEGARAAFAINKALRCVRRP